MLPACGGDDEKPRATSSPTVPVVLPSGTPTPKPPATKPTELVRTDLIEGTGRLALPGNTLTVNYIGAHFDGKVFDSSYDQGDHPLSFTLGGERVIRGWDEGLVGMRAGGRRQLVIPPEMGYGPEGGGPGHPIGPNETLIFVVDLISVDDGLLGGGNTFAPN